MSASSRDLKHEMLSIVADLLQLEPEMTQQAGGILKRLRDLGVEIVHFGFTKPDTIVVVFETGSDIEISIKNRMPSEGFEYSGHEH